LTTKASFTYDSDGYYICAPACFIPTNHKWIVALLNSSLSTFFFRSTAIERQGGFIEQKPMYVKEFPIPDVNEEIKDRLTKLVDSLLSLNSEMCDLNQMALEIFKTEYGLTKTNQKMEKFLSLGWNEFMEVLEKQHTLFSLQQKDELNNWYRGKQKSYQSLNQQIRKIDESIDNLQQKNILKGW
jgi:TaqI-like C-terminal specificity domain